MSQKSTEVKPSAKMYTVVECMNCENMLWFSNDEYISVSVRLKGGGFLEMFDGLMKCCEKPDYIFQVPGKRYAKIPRGAHKLYRTMLEQMLSKYLKLYPNMELKHNGNP